MNNDVCIIKTASFRPNPQLASKVNFLKFIANRAVFHFGLIDINLIKWEELLSVETSDLSRGNEWQKIVASFH